METMALLLNIPPNKTLLRRHLATHFNLLIGSEAQQLKQECLENPDYTLLTATTKVKVKHEFPQTDHPLLLTSTATTSQSTYKEDMLEMLFPTYFL